MNDRPVLIFGAPRSGTSLLSRLIDAHPRIAIPFESHLFNQWTPRLSVYGNLTNPARRRRLIRDIADFGVIRDWSPHPPADEVAALVHTPGFGGVASAFMTWWARSQGKPRWGEKTPHHSLLWRDTLAAWSDALVVIIERDPRDVALSWKEARFGGDHVSPFAAAWKGYQAAAEEVRSALDSDRWIDLRYEDLVDQPEAELARVMNFLGESYYPSQLAFHDTKDEWRTDSRNAAHLRQPVSAKSVGRWRTRLSTREVGLVEHIVGDVMTGRGYAPSSTAASPADLAFVQWVERPIKRITGLLKNRQGLVYLGRDIGWRLRLITEPIDWR